MKKVKLFCFPYAGGSAMIYNSWNKYIKDSIDIKPVELSGRGCRVKESLYNSINEAIEDVYNIVKREINEYPFAFFGHSLGNIIAYELACKIREQKYFQPFHLFLSGRGAPHICKQAEPIHNLSDGEFKKEIMKFGGTPNEFFEHPDLLEVFLPILRNDFRLAENYRYKGKSVVDCDISIFFGKEEDITTEEIIGWEKYTSKKCSFYPFDGGHFFIKKHIGKIVDIINRTILKELKIS